MFTKITRILRLAFYLFLILAGVTFAVSNRGRIDLTFYPLPYTISCPLFLFAILIFALGTLLGWLVSSVYVLRQRGSIRTTNKRVSALENELAALRTEQTIRHVALPPSAL